MTWAVDVVAVKAGELSFDVLARRHDRLITLKALPWFRRCKERLSLEEVKQEVLIHLWNGINRWVPGKLALDNYLGMWLRYRMMNYTGRVIEDSAMESVYGEYEPDSDEVLWVVSRDDRPEVAIDFRKGILRIVSRDACKARCVRELMQGQTVRQAVYAACGKAPHPERERFQNELITELTEMVKE